MCFAHNLVFFKDNHLVLQVKVRICQVRTFSDRTYGNVLGPSML